MPRQLKIVGGVAVLAVVLLGGVLAVGAVQDQAAGHGSGNHMRGAGNHTGSMGSGGHGGNHATPAEGHHEGNETNGTRAPVTWTVELKDDTFHSNNLTIQRGDTVKWVHAGSNYHTVTAENKSFDSHPHCSTVIDGALGRCMANGATYTRIFDNVGKVAYKCKLHQAMVATIDVKESYSRTPDTNHH